MKLTYRDIFTLFIGESYRASVIDYLLDQKVEVEKTYKIQELYENLKEENKKITSDIQKIFKKHGYSGVHLNEICHKIKDEKNTQFQKDYDQLMSQELEIDHTTIEINEMNDLKISTRNRMILDKIVTFKK